MTEQELAMLAEGRRPVVVVDDVHVTYRTYASGKRIAGGGASLLSRAARGTREVHALKGVSLVAFEGESIGVIGHNGSGKSTLFTTIAGFRPATRGSVWAEDRPALLGVNAALLSELSGDKNVRLGSLALGYTPAEVRERYDEIVEFSELGEFIDHPMRTYSAGMSARLRFAIAASKAHSIMLIDEALAVGDKSFQAKSQERIKELRDAAGTVFLVSHSMGSILETSTRVIWIDHGLVRMSGDPRMVVDAYTASQERKR